MSDKTGIEWTDSTWNPVTGCTKLSPASPGCEHCYASTFAERFRGTPGHYFEQGFDVQLRPDKLELPLKWRKPKRIFVNSMSDLFHDQVPDDYIVEVFAVMAAAPQHTFQVLTKRHGRMRSLVSSVKFQSDVEHRMLDQHGVLDNEWPLPNVWLGVSTENQQWADVRIPALLDTPAAVRFISAEPLLGPISIYNTSAMDREDAQLDWVIVGGESGHGARPMHPDWVRELRDECQPNRRIHGDSIAFLFKQWGEWRPVEPDVPDFRTVDDHLVFPDGPSARIGELNGQVPTTRFATMRRVGKKAAGRALDGRTWDQYPGLEES